MWSQGTVVRELRRFSLWRIYGFPLQFYKGVLHIFGDTPWAVGSRSHKQDGEFMGFFYGSIKDFSVEPRY